MLVILKLQSPCYIVVEWNLVNVIVPVPKNNVSVNNISFCLKSTSYEIKALLQIGVVA